MKQFFTWLVWSLLRALGLSDYVDSILVGIFVLIVTGGIILGIMYSILTFIVKLRKGRIKRNKEDYRTWFFETCKELMDADSKVEFDDEQALFRLQINNDTIVTFDPQADTLIVKKNEDPNHILPDAKPGDLRINLRCAGKESDAFTNCELASSSNNTQKNELSLEVTIPREKLRKGQLTDIKSAFERFETEYCYVPITSNRTYHKVYDLDEAFKTTKKAIKDVDKDAVVYHHHFTEESNQFRVLVYVKQKDASPEKMAELMAVIDNLPIGDNKKIILADGSVMYQ